MYKRLSCCGFLGGSPTRHFEVAWNKSGVFAPDLHVSESRAGPPYGLKHTRKIVIRNRGSSSFHRAPPYAWVVYVHAVSCKDAPPRQNTLHH